jgi:hypothetical protein
MGEVTIPKMLARTIFRVIVLVALTLQVFASVAEAVICKPCPAKATAVCPSSSDTATTSIAYSEGRTESSLPASHGPGDDHGSLCPFCLAPFIEASPVSVSPDDRIQRFAPAEHTTLYEAPSFSLLRPPIA